MQFNSYIFILFFLPIVVILYFIFNKMGRFNWAKYILFFSSLIFIGYIEIIYAIILIISLSINYCIFLIMQYYSTQNNNYKKLWCIVGVTFNIIVLLYFKYTNFFIENINYILGKNYLLTTIILPLGVSFYSFQQISFLISTFRDEERKCSFIDYALFVSFFAYVSSGPIVLYSEVVPQLNDIAKKEINYDNIADGIILFSIGLFKKVIIADTFGTAAIGGGGYFDPSILSSMEIILISFSFTMEIYFDFSGYSDMAIGIGRMFNINLPVNFRSPYKTTSVIEFWENWHITLTRFLRQYIYIPLGGNRKGRLRTYINIFTVFLISGLWHGASWNFILWGALHGSANIVNRIFESYWKHLNSALRWTLNFMFLNITWIIFRVTDMRQIAIIIRKIFIFDTGKVSNRFWDSFFLPEIQFVIDRIPIIRDTVINTNWFISFIFITVIIVALLKCDSLEEIRFKYNIKNLSLVICMLIWSILSFTGVSSFLYSNF